jgi:two-component system cell cycle response regulator DivK
MNTDASNTVLLVEDNEDSRDMLRKFLLMEGFSVFEAKNGEEAIITAQEKKPDLILLDLNLPILDGIQAAEIIRSQTELCGIPIVAISAYGNRGMELFNNIRLLGDAYIGYLTKPISFGELNEQINAALNRVPNEA